MTRITDQLGLYEPRVLAALNEIQRSYGDKVSTESKGKSLLKFGKTTNADQNVRTTVATFGSVGTPNVNETFSTTNDIDRVVSSNSGDTETLVVEGHTIDGSGNLTFSIQNVTLTGQTPAILDTPLARCTRMYVADGTFASPSSNLVGDIYVFASDGVTVTAGVPQTNTAVKARIVAGSNVTQKAATSISSVDYWIITQAVVSLARATGASVAVDCEIERRRIGGVFRPFGMELQIRVDANQQVTVDFSPCLIVRPNSDVRLVATSNTNDTTVEGYVSGYLAKVIG